MSQALCINPDKNQRITVGGQAYSRFAIKTPLVKAGNDLTRIVTDCVKPHLQQGDIVFISEKMVACAQGRAIPLRAIKPTKMATFLSRFVYKSPYGIGLALPETMTMAIMQCGLWRILLAAAIGAVGKVLGQKGWFYRIAGAKAAAIDGPCPKTIAPYNTCVVLGPDRPQQVAQDLSRALGGTTVLIVDINDLGGKILGSSAPKRLNAHYLALLSDNPLGQTDEQTPLGIIRPHHSTAADTSREPLKTVLSPN